MKKVKIVLFLCILLCLSSSIQIHAANTAEVKARWYDTGYYPLYPGNEEWQKHDMFATLDILNPPHDLLLGMSTQELANLMQEHPLMSQSTAYYGEDGNQDYGTFYAFMETNSDIFYELLRREDGFSCILEAYRSHEIDTELLNKTEYASVQEAHRAHTMWWQEIYGCQFINHYAHHFTESEHKLACEIIAQKKELYKALSDTNLYYLDLHDLDQGPAKEVTAIRTNYLTEAQIQEKEERLKAAQEQMEQSVTQVEQAENSVEQAETQVMQAKNIVEEGENEDEDRDTAKAPLWIAAMAGIGCLLGGGLMILRRKKK